MTSGSVGAGKRCGSVGVGIVGAGVIGVKPNSHWLL